MPKEDEDDILTENINTAIYLCLGILSMIVSIAIIINSVVMTLYSQQLPMDFTYRLIFAPLFFIIGLVLFQVFRKRRESRKNKASAFF